MTEQEIQDFAKKRGYIRAEYKGKWKEYKVYEPIYKDGNETYWVGKPRAILVKENEIKFNNGLRELNDIIRNTIKE